MERQIVCLSTSASGDSLCKAMWDGFYVGNKTSTTNGYKQRKFNKI